MSERRFFNPRKLATRAAVVPTHASSRRFASPNAAFDRTTPSASVRFDSVWIKKYRAHSTVVAR